MRFRLSYRQIECQRCSAPRVVGVVCPECGARPAPHEADSDAQIRARRAASARSLLESDARASTGTADTENRQGDPFEGHRRIAEWFPEFERATERAASEKVYSGDLDREVAKFRQIERAVHGAVRQRPWLTTWADLDEFVLSVRSVIESCLTALASATPLQAQAEEAKMQRALNAAEDARDRVERRLQTMERLQAASTEEDAAQLLVEEVYGGANVQGILELDAAGQELLQDATTATGPISGLGLAFLLADARARVALDPQRFWRVVREVHQFLHDHAARFSSSVREPAWTSEYANAYVLLMDAAAEHRALSLHDRPTRAHVRSLLTLGLDLVEVSRPLLATLVGVRGKTTWSTAMGKDAADLVRVLAARGGEDWTAGLQSTVRNARAHLTYRIAGSSIDFVNGSRIVETMQVSELIDSVLAGYESLFAIALAIESAAHVVAGVDLDEMENRFGSHVRLEDRIGIVLAAHGLRGVAAVINGTSLQISGEGDPDAAPVIALASLAPYLAGTAIEEVALHLTGASPRWLSGPVEPLRARAACSEDFDRELHFARFLRQWRMNSDPLMADDHFRKWIATYCGKALSGSPNHRILRLKQLRSFATESDDTDLANALNAFIRGIRLESMGEPVPETLRQEWALLTQWEQRRLPPLAW